MRLVNMILIHFKQYRAALLTRIKLESNQWLRHILYLCTIILHFPSERYLCKQFIQARHTFGDPVLSLRWGILARFKSQVCWLAPLTCHWLLSERQHTKLSNNSNNGRVLGRPALTSCCLEEKARVWLTVRVSSRQQQRLALCCAPSHLRMVEYLCSGQHKLGVKWEQFLFVFDGSVLLPSNKRGSV